MDTLTQMTLGAAVGEAVLGQKAGNKAVLWGAIGGLIPDLDIIPGWFMDEVDRLVFHRGFSHSLLFSVLLSLIAGFLLHKRYRRTTKTTFQDWTLLFFLALTTHILLDCFTTYGTQVFYPFSTYKVAFNTISVIDPLYSMPFMICVVAVTFSKRHSRRRTIINYIGLGISTFYLLLTVVNKFYMASVFEKRLQYQNIEYQSISTYPTLLNNFLWRGIADAGDGYYVGYYSLFDANQNIQFRKILKNHQLLSQFKQYSEICKLTFFSKNEYALRRENGAIIYNDMRYGPASVRGDNTDSVFSYRLERASKDQPELKVTRAHSRTVNQAEFAYFIKRIFGKN